MAAERARRLSRHYVLEDLLVDTTFPDLAKRLEPDERAIKNLERLTALLDKIVDRFPHEFLRGLLHSDGARVANWATRIVAGERRRYDYPRWQFVNHSEQILGWCCDALDLVDVPWRRSGRWTVSVSTRAGVARLDELVGPKR